MKFINSQFLSRAEFSKLSLHEKNDYLVSIADEYAREKGYRDIKLSKDALSRLRRFYSRRSAADLKINDTPDKVLKSALLGIADVIRKESFEKAIEAEIPPSQSSSSINRLPPIDDDQLMFFVPQIHDAPLKDDVNILDIAPFSLSKSRRDGVIRYDLKDCTIQIEGGSQTGIANAFDYDIFLNMVSYLAEEMRKYHRDASKGIETSLPPRSYRPTASQIFKFCRRNRGGRQFEELERSLDRLQATRIKITNTSKGKRREVKSFSLIGTYRVVSRTTTGLIDNISIEIPDWVYSGVVKDKDYSSILTLNPDYFLIRKPTARFIYRLARKAAGKGEAHYSFTDLYHRSGSVLPYTKFKSGLLALIESCETDPLPDYDLTIKPGRDCPVLCMQHRQSADSKPLL